MVVSCCRCRRRRCCGCCWRCFRRRCGRHLTIRRLLEQQRARLPSRATRRAADLLKERSDLAGLSIRFVNDLPFLHPPGSSGCGGCSFRFDFDPQRDFLLGHEVDPEGFAVALVGPDGVVEGGADAGGEGGAAEGGEAVGADLVEVEEGEW